MHYRDACRSTTKISDLDHSAHLNGLADLSILCDTSRDLERNTAAMVEPKGKMDSLAPFASDVKASVSMFDGKNSGRTLSLSGSLHQPFLLHPPTHHVGAFHHLSPKAAVDSSHYTQVTRSYIFVSLDSFTSILYLSWLRLH